MSININDLNYENTADKRFYLRENGQIIYKYDFFNENIKNLGPNQDLLMEDRTDNFALPEFWYYRSNCPSYIVVTDIASYDTIETDIGKKLSVSATSQTSGSDIVITFDIRHNKYTHISQASNLSSENDLAGVTTEVPVGTDSTVSENNVSLHFDTLNISTSINIVSGRGSLVLDGSKITYPYLSGHITLGNDHSLYFNIENIELISSVVNSNKTEEMLEERDRRLSACDWLVIRHITQQVIGQTSLSEETFEDLCNYMQDLRDLPSTVQDLDNIDWPSVPQSLENILV